MRTIALLLAISIMFSCNQKKPCPAYPDIIRVDTVEVPVPVSSADLSTIDFRSYQDSIVKVIDTLKTNLFISEYKVEKVKYYLSIVLRNPSQEKFLKGWIRRAVE